MLSTLRIRHIGVIDDAVLEFGPGFTALTGETGAGKTMIVTGLTMLLGARLDRGRTGEAATVAGTLRLDGHDALRAALEELGADEDDGDLLVVRRVTRDGRSRAHIGGVPVPIGTLAAHVGSAVTVHGQADQLRLRESDAQRTALDAYAADEISPALARHRDVFARRAALAARARELEDLLAQRDRRGALLRDALERLETVDPQPGEDDAVREDIEQLSHAAEVREDLARAALALVGDDDTPSVSSLLALAADAVSKAQRVDSALQETSERLTTLGDEISDIAAALSRRAEDIDTGPGALDEAHARLHELTALVRDLGPTLPGPDGPATTVTELLETSRSAARDLDRFDGAEQEHTAVLAELETVEQELEDAASALTDTRVGAADRLAAAVRDELVQLEMPGADIRVEISPGPHREHGRDSVAILLAPHPGAQHRPVADAASGGELSRVMLALEVALASSRRDRTAAPVFVFDEIDAGIGGRAALAVGQRLAALARHAQVIVVTHLPQVAAHAGTHLRIVKTTDGTATSSDVELLDRQGRVRELARMLAGDDASARALAHADELLNQAQALPAGDAEEDR